MDISDTLKKVDKSLNLRFERDSSLYISKDDEEKVKEALFKSNYQDVSSLSKKLGNKVLAKVIVNNNWLVDMRKGQKTIQDIFRTLDSNFLLKIIDGIIQDKIYSTNEFKAFIEIYYSKVVPLKDCLNFVQDSNRVDSSRILYFKRYLIEDYLINHSTSNSIRFIDQQFSKNPELYSFVQNRNTSFLKDVFTNITDTEIIAEWIMDNKIQDIQDQVWKNLFISLGQDAFESVIEYLQNNGTYDDFTKYLIQKILYKFAKLDNFQDEVEQLYRNHFKIRILFIHMIEPSKFGNKDISNQLLDRFEKIGIQNAGQKSVEPIRNWNLNNYSSNGFKDLNEIIEKIDEKNQDFNRRNTLEFYYKQFSKTDFKTILELFNKHKDDKRVINILSYYYLILFLEIGKSFIKLKVIESEQEYVDKITHFAELFNINTEFSRKFLHKYNKDELFLKFNRR